jgi:hypothetical protein
MSESDRVRGSLRAKVFIADVRYHDGLFCPYCQKPFTVTPHVDHVQSRKSGGDKKEMSNLITCCPSCNGRKCDTDVLALFGSDIHYAVNEQLKNRVLTTADHQAAVDIFNSGSTWQERIEMILDWVQLGMLPIRLQEVVCE